jgi:hypothetical protein
VESEKIFYSSLIIVLQPQLNNIDIKLPFFHWRANYDHLMRDEFRSRSSFEHPDLLLDTFCLSTIFAEKTADALEGTIKKLFKKKKKKKDPFAEMCQSVDSHVRVSLSVGSYIA